MDIDHALSNAACASQHLPILENSVVRGALLRSLHQWLSSEERQEWDLGDFLAELEAHPDYDN